MEVYENVMIKSKRPNSAGHGLQAETKSVNSEHLGGNKQDNQIEASHVADEQSHANTNKSIKFFNITGNAGDYFSDKYSVALNSSVQDLSNFYVKNVLNMICEQLNYPVSDKSK